MSGLILFALGIGLLIGGLFIMRLGLRRVFSLAFRQTLLRLTLSPWRGMLAGAVAAALMQSSTAVTMLTVGLVSADYLSFYQALGIVLGANIGTCSTVQLLTLSLPLEFLLPLIASAGLFALASKRRRHIALSIVGLLSMFAGISFLSQGLGSLSELNMAISFLAAGQNPLYGICGGILLTFLVQSSSAATGLLMVLSSEGIIDLTTATYGVYGNNIGSCLSSLLISVSAPLAARKVAVAHILLNVLGVIVFLPLSGCLVAVASLFSDNFGNQVAAIHTLFNIVSSLAVLPFIRQFARLVSFLMPGKAPRW